ncbi:MAG: hypothetical protein WA862_06360 [Solirubrobacterales bacterium]
MRDRAEKAGFREPDWYAGPLVDENASELAFDNSDPPLDEATRDLDLKQELSDEMEKTAGVRQIRAAKPSLLSRLRHLLSRRLASHPDAR